MRAVKGLLSHFLIIRSLQYNENILRMSKFISSQKLENWSFSQNKEHWIAIRGFFILKICFFTLIILPNLCLIIKHPIYFLVAVVISFFVCWTPFHAQRLLAIYTTEVTPVLLITFTILTHISGVTYYLSATLNPILYQLLSLNFRQAFKDTFGRRTQKSGGKFAETSRYKVSSQAKDALTAAASWMSDISNHQGLMSWNSWTYLKQKKCETQNSRW